MARYPAGTSTRRDHAELRAGPGAVRPDEPDDDRLLLAFYGDDFTGSTDALEALAVNGVQAVLFLRPADAASCSAVSRMSAPSASPAISRSRCPGADGRACCPPVFERSRRSARRSVHYKVCSTFDSLARGRQHRPRHRHRAASLRRRRSCRCVVGAPALGRYCLFGNLFATAGERDLPPRPPPDDEPAPGHADGRGRPAPPPGAPDGEADRADGHASILRVRRSRLTAGSTPCLGTGPEVVLFDVLDEPRLAEVGRLIWSRRGLRAPVRRRLLGIGSRLTAHWRAAGMLPEPEPFRPPGPSSASWSSRAVARPRLGSRSLWARAHGFATSRSIPPAWSIPSGPRRSGRR